MSVFQRFILTVLLFLFSMCNVFAQEVNITHEVKSGETVRSISLKYNITPYDLIKLNPDVEDPPMVGVKLIIPKLKNNDNLDKAKLDDINSSKDKIVGDIIYHTVKPKETIYSFNRKYGIKAKDLYQANPALIDGLKIGMILNIPISKLNKEEKVIVVSRDTAKYVMHIIAAKETKWGLCHKYGITEVQLLESNPIVSKGVNYGDTLWIPKKEINKVVEVDNINFNYTYYEVKPQDTSYGISKKFNITIGELKFENPLLIEGLKIGMVLKIPKSSREVYDTVKFVQQTFTNLPNDSILSSNEKIEELDKLEFTSVVDVVLMLPFYLNKNAEFIKAKTNNNSAKLTDEDMDGLEIEEPKIFSKSAIALEFYNGALFAIDSLKKMGLSVRLKVFDTEKDINVIKRIMDNNDFSEVDVVIGPLYTENVEYVADRLKYDNVLVVSPLSKKLDLDNRYNLIQSMPTSFTTKNSVLKEVIDEQSDSSNVVVFGGLIDKTEVDFVESRLKSKLDSNIISTYIAEENLVDREVVFELLNPNKDNVVIIASKSNVLITDVITALNQVTDSLPNRAFLLSRPKILDQFESGYLNSVSLAYPEDYFVDHNSDVVKKFDIEFKKKNKYYPRKFSYRGFDVTYDMLYSLGKSSNLEVGILNNNKRYIQGRFNYIRKPFGGYYNNGVFVIRYLDWSLVDVTK